MKIRTTRYIIKEGIFNAYKNKLMSIASMSIVIASLLIFGIFYLITVNFNSNLNYLKEQPEIQVFCFPELDDAQVNQVESSIKSDGRVQEYKMVTKEEAFKKVKNEMFSGKEGLLEDIDESIMPVSFIVKLKNPEDSDQIVEQFKAIEGVETVTYAQQAIEFIAKVTYWIPMISSFILITLLVVSMLIIANTIKLTVFARRREINIMKYIGATDWFIRWPFIIEGVIIGVVGAIIAFIITAVGYGTFEKKISSDLVSIGFNIIKLVKFNETALRIILLYTLTGAVVGAIGSIISIRKYLHV